MNHNHNVCMGMGSLIILLDDLQKIDFKSEDMNNALVLACLSICNYLLKSGPTLARYIKG